jgi:hypothetical protein
MQIASVEIMKHTTIEVRQHPPMPTLHAMSPVAVDGADLLVQRLVDRCDVHWWIQSTDPSHLAASARLPTSTCAFTTQETITLAEDFLKLIHGIVCDRAYYLCDTVVLKCFIIHILPADGDQITHSQIIQFLPAEWTVDHVDVIDAILIEVANFIPPPRAPSASGTSKCGVYQLKSTYWSHAISPSLYWQYAPHEMVLAEEKSRNWQRKQQASQQKREVGIVAATHFLHAQQAQSVA